MSTLAFLLLQAAEKLPQGALPGGSPKGLSELPEALSRFMRGLLFLPPEASTLADNVDTLHFYEFITMWGLAAIVMAAAIWFAIRYRRRSDDAPTPRVIAPLWFELGGALFLFALWIGWWVVSFRQYVDLTVPPPGAMQVYVTAKQWMWKFSYPDGSSSAGIMFVPAGKPIKLVIGSRDVIHSFYVPAFRIKRDAVPGQYESLWFEAPTPGSYQILCAEYCGVGHSRMWGAVVVLAPADYARWKEGEAPAVPEADVGLPPVGAAPSGPPPVGGLAALGQRVAAKYGCLACHSVDGTTGLPQHIGPTWLGLYGSTVTLSDGTQVQADAQYITRSMMEPKAQVVAGYPPVMPSFQGQVSNAEAAALVEYIRWLRNPQAATEERTR